MIERAIVFEQRSVVDQNVDRTANGLASIRHQARRFIFIGKIGLNASRNAARL
jgi:hypothetical protein